MSEKNQVFPNEAYQLAGVAIEIWKARGGDLPSGKEGGTWHDYIDEAEHLLMDSDFKLGVWRQQARTQEAAEFRVSFADLLEQESSPGAPESERRVLGRVKNSEALVKKVKEVFPSQAVYDKIFEVVLRGDYPPLPERFLDAGLHPAAEKALKDLKLKLGEHQTPYLNRWVSICFSHLEETPQGFFPFCAEMLGEIRGHEKIVEEEALTMFEVETLRRACSVSLAAKKGIINSDKR